MKNMTLEKIAEACGGILYEGIGQNEKEKEASCVVIDSRRMEPGGVFIATRGEKVDGHSFIPAVAAGGALGIVCEERPAACEAPCIVVEDSFQALKDIAEYYRRQLDIQVVGITGSVGKTSTKEFIASVLAQKYSVLKTQGNFNNEIGLPLTVLSIKKEHQVAVLEMGINNFGEMHRLSRIAKPDICVMTNIGQCHLEYLGTREGILKAKSEIFDFMNPEGSVFVNGDDDLLRTLKKPGTREITHFGLDPENEIFASEVLSKGLFGSHAVIHADLQVFPVEIPLPGEHMVLNALAAAGVGSRLGLTPAQIQTGISEVERVAGRSNVLSLEGFTLIDDCYNANPVSMCAALDLLAMAFGRKVAILGDMFELGEEEERLHEEVGCYAAQKGIDVILCAGPLAENMYRGAEKAGTRGSTGTEGTIGTKCAGEVRAASGGCEIHYFKTRDELIGQLSALLKKGDSILVKASHGMQFEKVVEAVRKL